MALICVADDKMIVNYKDKQYLIEKFDDFVYSVAHHCIMRTKATSDIKCPYYYIDYYDGMYMLKYRDEAGHIDIYQLTYKIIDEVITYLYFEGEFYGTAFRNNEGSLIVVDKKL